MEAKIEAITAAINNVNTTLESKLALIEAAIKAQTLSLTAKLDLLESAIKAIPDYSDKFDAVVAALNAMKTQVEALGTAQASIATQIAGVTTAINNLIAAVNSSNTDAATALAQIIQKLEELKAAIGNGTPTGDYVTCVTSKAIGEVFTIGTTSNEVAEVSGAVYYSSQQINPGVIFHNYKITSQTITIKGKLTYLNVSNNQLTRLMVNIPGLTELVCDKNLLTSVTIASNDLSSLSVGENQLRHLNLKNYPKLTYLNCRKNKISDLDLSANKKLVTFYCEENKLTSLDFSNNKEISVITCCSNQISGEGMQTLANSLPKRSRDNRGYIVLLDKRTGTTEGNIYTDAQMDKIVDKWWNIYKGSDTGHEWIGCILVITIIVK